MTRYFRAASAVLAAATIAATPAWAQSPTPEGTVVQNTANATWTEANGNTYAPATASVSVTVGFIPGPTLSSSGTFAPASPSSNNEITYTITNNGNGADGYDMSATAGSGITITGYRSNGTVYNSLQLLMAALPLNNVPAGGSMDIGVIYDVATSVCSSTSITFSATSKRAPSASGANDTEVTALSPTCAGGVTVSAGTATRNRLPSNGTQYTETYTVTNTGGGSTTFTLGGASNPGTGLTIVSVDGTAGASASLTLAAGASKTVNVIYTIGDVAAGSTETLTLTATSQADASVTASASTTITVVRPALAMTKQAYRDDKTTQVSGTVVPGEYIQYKITVTNNGTADATTVQITDALPSQLTYISSAGDTGSDWTLSETSGTVTASLSGSLAPSASRFIWIRVQVK